MGSTVKIQYLTQRALNLIRWDSIQYDQTFKYTLGWIILI